MRKRYVIFILFFILFGIEIFSKTTEERLKEGEIITEYIKRGEIEGVRILAIIDAPIEDVWKVITNYEDFKNFMPTCEDSKILKRKGNTVYYKGVVKILTFTTTYHLEYTHNIKKDKMVDCWKSAKGEYEYKGKNPVELKKNYGCWTLERYDGNKTKSIYEPYVEIKMPESVPEYLINKITNILLKVSAPGVIKATRERIEGIKEEIK